jgi:hypothetical protein
MVGFQEILSFGNPRYWSSLQSGNCLPVDRCREKPQREIFSFPEGCFSGITFHTREFGVLNAEDLFFTAGLEPIKMP